MQGPQHAPGSGAAPGSRFAFKHEDFPALGADKKPGQMPTLGGSLAPGLAVSPPSAPPNIAPPMPSGSTGSVGGPDLRESDSWNVLGPNAPTMTPPRPPGALEAERRIEVAVDNEIKSRFGHLSNDLRKSLKVKLLKERQEAQSKLLENDPEANSQETGEPWYPSENLGQFGLLGLLRVIRMTEADLNMLALGVDLTKLGLNLNSPDYLSQSFGSPWSETPMREQDPEYWLPPSYYVHPTSIKNAHLGRFTVDTVFYLFHNVPGDLLQTYAATELCLRGWRYHVDLQLWFRTVPEENARGADGRPVNQPQWIYFDPQQWQKCFYRKPVDKSRFLPVEDCQVKEPRQGIVPKAV